MLRLTNKTYHEEIESCNGFFLGIQYILQEAYGSALFLGESDFRLSKGSLMERIDRHYDDNLEMALHDWKNGEMEEFHRNFDPNSMDGVEFPPALWDGTDKVIAHLIHFAGCSEEDLCGWNELDAGCAAQSIGSHIRDGSLVRLVLDPNLVDPNYDVRHAIRKWLEAGDCDPKSCQHSKLNEHLQTEMEFHLSDSLARSVASGKDMGTLDLSREIVREFMDNFLSRSAKLAISLQ
mgnify:CR=1 FL=1|tara:strand:+ start:303 stop:1007 length:705 start_codon:yes stop_codon:yes gene_type:complete